ncbi:MAG: protein-disulfide reductase DsbD family protein, partial [Bdellovibrionales bacterium]
IFEQAHASLPITYEESIDSRITINEATDEVIITVNENEFTNQINEEAPVVFFSYDWGLVKAGSPATISKGEDNKVAFAFPRADRALAEIKTFEGVLAQEEKGVAIDSKSLQIIEKSSGDEKVVKEIDAKEDRLGNNENGGATIGLLTAVLFAVFGGLILNLMPCVFPILSMKALSLVKIASKNRKESLLHGMSYTAGILLSFLGLAGAIIALKAGGAEIGWGFQLQNPLVVMLIVWLLFVIGLNLFGAFDITGRFTQIGSNKLANAQGYTQDFFTGVLAVIVATPCTAPFMGVALGYALVQPAYVTILVFLGLGLGLALPFLLLSIMPALQKIMPKPGAWMETFKQFLAFPMWATAIWLVWVLVQQSGAQGLVSVLSGVLIISFVLWLIKHKPKGPLKAFKTLALIFCVIGLWKSGTMLGNLKTEQVAYSPTVLENALKTDNPVFVNMTAAWCITCKVNEISIKSDEVQKLFEEKGMTYIVGDWTLMDSEITKYLESFDRTGVPLYVYYPSGDRENPVVLPQILTPQIIEEIIN